VSVLHPLSIKIIASFAEVSIMRTYEKRKRHGKKDRNIKKGVEEIKEGVQEIEIEEIEDEPETDDEIEEEEENENHRRGIKDCQPYGKSRVTTNSLSSTAIYDILRPNYEIAV